MKNSQINKQFNWKFYDYAFDLEKKWRSSLSRFTDKELLKIFPEAKKIIPEKIQELEERRTEVLEILKKKLTLIKYKITDEFSYWLFREWIKINEGQNLLEIDQQIDRLKRLLFIAQGRRIKGRITEKKIQQALSVPIENIANQHLKLRKTGKALVGLCPFHLEKHPSFYIYPETNSCWCYGCSQGGNIINFVRLLYGYSFKETIKYLTGKNEYKNEYEYKQS